MEWSMVMLKKTGQQRIDETTRCGEVADQILPVLNNIREIKKVLQTCRRALVLKNEHFVN